MENNRIVRITDSTVEKFFKQLYDQKALLQHFLEEIVSFKEILNTGFALGVKINNTLIVYTLSQAGQKENIEKLEVQVSTDSTSMSMTSGIENIFVENVIGSKSGEYVKKVRCIYKDRDSNVEIYYFSCFLEQKLFNTMYIQNVEFEYCWWITWLLTKFLRIAPKANTKDNTEENDEDNIKNLDAFRVTDKMKNITVHRIQDSFHETVLALLKVDLDFIISLSGAYYEGDECSAILEYCLIYSDEVENIAKKMAIALHEPVEISKNNVRKIRKLIQVVQEGQCLVATLENGRWSIRGICDNEHISEKYITFRFLRHMVWTMEYMGKPMICYNCGRYCIDSKELKTKEFCEKYKRVFGIDASEDVVSIIERAIDQTHGTTVLLIDKANISNTIDYLLGNKIGFKIRKVDPKLSKDIITGITSIDGTALLDQDGNSYGMGIILDNTAKKSSGRSDRGARFNSAQHYIDSCNDKKLAAMAIVVSADRTVDILITKWYVRR